MKYAILSDVHANREALSVVLDYCQSLGVEAYISLGDIVGYNAEPAECLHMIRALPIAAMVRGNHDEYTARKGDDMVGFNPHAREAVRWTQSKLTDEELDFLMSAPYKARLPNSNITLVHATLDSPENWGYIFDVHHAADSFNYQFTQLSFCGHSHVPVAFFKKPISTTSERSIDEIPSWCSNPEFEDFNQAVQTTVEIKPGYKYLFNVGSVGQPRNRDPRASFAIYDTVERTVSRYMLPYDIASAQNKIINAGLPERLALRLANGS